ncbi:TetR/AcrR family transcriptional regulator [Actinomadura rayongensis]|uniref:TetR family transcriptional regulator n=1 Tax=Actinomadura rayongensis TaxID=1429076 RepID=A0A6I4W4V3_9ACTN|nr:TetR/AcrR family transcriptional regulator [Actinomadura rayongensis]MXQ65217.1 TetR family transcriptional regulator [Actinomadura rayongensis]
MTDPVSSDKRRYRGMDGPERQAARRASLLAAGLELFGTVGYVATTVEAVCREAGLAKKYFYESFADREALMLAIYDDAVRRGQEAALVAVAGAGPTIEERIAAGLGAVIRALGTDPRVTRLVFREIIRVATPVSEERYRQAKRDFAEFVIADLTATAGIPRTKRMQMGTTQLVGAFNEIMTERVLGHLDATLDEVTEITVTVFNVVYRQYMRELAEDAG